MSDITVLGHETPLPSNCCASVVVNFESDMQWDGLVEWFQLHGVSIESLELQENDDDDGLCASLIKSCPRLRHFTIGNAYEEMCESDIGASFYKGHFDAFATTQLETLVLKCIWLESAVISLLQRNPLLRRFHSSFSTTSSGRKCMEDEALVSFLQTISGLDHLESFQFFWDVSDGELEHLSLPRATDCVLGFYNNHQEEPDSVYSSDSDGDDALSAQAWLGLYARSPRLPLVWISPAKRQQLWTWLMVAKRRGLLEPLARLVARYVLTRDAAQHPRKRAKLGNKWWRKPSE